VSSPVRAVSCCWPLFLIIGLGLLVAACSPSGIVPVGSGGVAATASPHAPLTPAQRRRRTRFADAVFNPIFQLLYHPRGLAPEGDRATSASRSS